ncbi:Lrp/AsnC family transcriptional regulator [Pelagibacteraceae bacterium]|jgi:Lrp/AsnC family leucine-responsive transcriptional regulator|nr:Lrp/AsnC family transcriptional regulator [Pelagibacteraceae bacterium]MDC3056203.1 Lrp/AsnC family transcriptional regulator [Pelagibacteraceae bacterium]|tara:strand:+ start:1383 stop:1820 length:438 start_codon:yes stop_codon:yes gene_type:complete
MIDKIDDQIIRILAKNGRITLSDLAKEVNLSISPCQARLKKLEEKKYILGYHARINYEQLQKAHVAFVQVVLSDTRASALENFNREVSKLESIEQCHMIAGSFDYLLKVRTKNISEYRLLLAEKISSLPNVASTSTFVSMESVKD